MGLLRVASAMSLCALAFAVQAEQLPIEVLSAVVKDQKIADAEVGVIHIQLGVGAGLVVEVDVIAREDHVGVEVRRRLPPGQTQTSGFGSLQRSQLHLSLSAVPLTIYEAGTT